MSCRSDVRFGHPCPSLTRRSPRFAIVASLGLQRRRHDTGNPSRKARRVAGLRLAARRFNGAAIDRSRKGPTSTTSTKALKDTFVRTIFSARPPCTSPFDFTMVLLPRRPWPSQAHLRSAPVATAASASSSQLLIQPTSDSDDAMNGPVQDLPGSPLSPGVTSSWA